MLDRPARAVIGGMFDALGAHLAEPSAHLAEPSAHLAEPSAPALRKLRATYLGKE